MEANTFLSELTTGLIIALVPVIVGALGYVARAAINYLKARTSAAHYDLLRQLAGAAVRASEQALKGKSGQEKLVAARAVVASALLAKGIKLDESAITTAIESAVWVEKGLWVDTPASTPSPVEALPDVTFTVNDETF